MTQSEPIDYEKCALYAPGHQVHFIQARLSLESCAASPRDGQVLSVHDDGWIAVEVDGEARRLWTHDPARARASFDQSGGRVGIPECGVLRVDRRDGTIDVICIADDGPTPCHPPTITASVAEQIETYDGVVIPWEALTEPRSSGSVDARCNDVTDLNLANHCGVDCLRRRRRRFRTCAVVAVSTVQLWHSRTDASIAC